MLPNEFDGACNLRGYTVSPGNRLPCASVEDPEVDTPGRGGRDSQGCEVQHRPRPEPELIRDARLDQNIEHGICDVGAVIELDDKLLLPRSEWTLPQLPSVCDPTIDAAPPTGGG